MILNFVTRNLEVKVLPKNRKLTKHVAEVQCLG